MAKKVDRPTRAPLTRDELARIPSRELPYMKLSDAETTMVREISQEKSRIRALHAVHLREQQEPIIADLRRVGITVESVWDLVNFPGDYPDAVPVLLEHLMKPYPDAIRDGIARALAVPSARCAWPQLITLYQDVCRATSAEKQNQFRSGLAAAIGALANDSVIEKLAELAKDKSNGSSRLLLLSGLRRSRSAVAKETIEILSTDPELEREIARWKRKR